MILVLSSDMYEQGTDPVVDWLAYYQAPFLRLSMDQLIYGKTGVVVDVDKEDLIVDNVNIREEVNVVWFRRMLPKQTADDEFGVCQPKNLHEDIREEASCCLEFIYYLLADKMWLPHFDSVSVNKLMVLNRAGKYQIKVPHSRLINNREDLETFFQENNGRVVTKPVHGAVFYLKDDYAYLSFTKRMRRQEIDLLPDTFFTSLYQEFIESDFEVRLFYLDGSIYPLAMLPSKADERQADIKYTRLTQPLHYHSFRLTGEEKESLHQLMQDLHLNICTIDLLKRGSELVLVDVNPVGQYLFESQHGNRFLEKAIAEWLIKQDGKRVNQNSYKNHDAVSHPVP